MKVVKEVKSLVDGLNLVQVRMRGEGRGGDGKGGEENGGEGRRVEGREREVTRTVWTHSEN